ncbi:hypothetical protein ABD87_14645 [Lysinibacillus sphaericus]|uniref:DUF4365 domain-containing protein n=1 Tax=Lysinibacillus sphaericus TaxID=1421 RepID=UPI0018CDB46D|nr:DUF4365 domain-containing protein [Lysinibacillus sphaericus]MBG9730739.1 hypothetical protein [Lysinibacillus sphaericus]
MNLPKRTDQLAQENKSDAIFRDQFTDVFNKWIINKVPTDVGIDYEVQVVLNGQVTGDKFYVQLKSKESIEWNKKHNCSITVKGTTVKYWMHEDAPVYIFLVDIEKKEMYYCNVKNYVRCNFLKFLDLYNSETPTKTKNFKINRIFRFSPSYPKMGERFAYDLYREKIHIPILDNLNQLHSKMGEIQKNLFLMVDDVDNEFEQKINEILNIEDGKGIEDNHSITSVIRHCELLLSIFYDVEYDKEYLRLMKNVEIAKDVLSNDEKLSQYAIENIQSDIFEMQKYLLNHYAFVYGNRELLYWRFREEVLKETKYLNLLDEFVALDSTKI